MGNKSSSQNNTLRKIKKTGTWKASRKNFKHNSEIRIVIIGSKGCGKSCLVVRAMNRKFDSNYVETIEDTYKRKVSVGQTQINIACFDMGRVEKNLYEERIKTADGILLCVGLDDVASFTDAVGVHSEIMKVRSKYLPFIAVGTKCDSTTRKVPLDTFRGHFHRVGVPTFETSARSDICCYEPFAALSELILNRIAPLTVGTFKVDRSTQGSTSSRNSSNSAMSEPESGSQSSFTEIQSTHPNNSNGMIIGHNGNEDQVAKRWSGNLDELLKENPEMLVTPRTPTTPSHNGLHDVIVVSTQHEGLTEEDQFDFQNQVQRTASVKDDPVTRTASNHITNDDLYMRSPTIRIVKEEMSLSSCGSSLSSSSPKDRDSGIPSPPLLSHSANDSPRNSMKVDGFQRPNRRTGTLIGTTNTLGVPAKYVVNFSEVVVGKQLGSGCFGEVYQGLWRGTSVAVKMNKIKSVEARSEFLHEASVMMSLKTHSHVVSLLGITLNPISLLAEYMDNGSMEKYLEANPEIKLTQKVKWMHQIAAGMYHLHRENVVHKDIAARNVLLNQALVAKISDFGLARILNDNDGEHVSDTDVGPVKWMAPESLTQKKYTPKTDVYSYGIVGVEILTQQAPFPKLSSYEYLRQYNSLNIHKLIIESLPADTPSLLEALILQCTHSDDHLRHDFDTILTIFQKIENPYT